jgi:hypothetical protein
MTGTNEDNLMGVFPHFFHRPFLNCLTMAVITLLVPIAVFACFLASANAMHMMRQLKLQHLAGFVPVTQVADQVRLDDC